MKYRVEREFIALFRSYLNLRVLSLRPTDFLPSPTPEAQHGLLFVNH